MLWPEVDQPCKSFLVPESPSSRRATRAIATLQLLPLVTEAIVVCSCWQLPFCCCHHIHAHLQTSLDSTAYAAMRRYVSSLICAESLHQGIRQARTCQCPLQLTTVEGTEVDISLGSDDGVKAAEIIKAKLQEFPLARPLTIVIKAFLKARRLTDVSTGGLGGYALVNMVIAHLQEEAKVSSTARSVVLQAVPCWCCTQHHTTHVCICGCQQVLPLKYICLLLTSVSCSSVLVVHSWYMQKLCAYTTPLRSSE